MFIAISTGTCRLALAKAIAAIEAVLADDRAAVREKSFNALHDGAVHNGLKPSPADLQKMNEMVDRDLDHMMEQHPGQEHLDHCKNLLAMLDHTDDPEVAIDDADFRVLRTHLEALHETSAAA